MSGCVKTWRYLFYHHFAENWFTPDAWSKKKMLSIWEKNVLFRWKIIDLLIFFLSLSFENESSWISPTIKWANLYQSSMNFDNIQRINLRYSHFCFYWMNYQLPLPKLLEKFLNLVLPMQKITKKSPQYLKKFKFLLIALCNFYACSEKDDVI